MTKRKANEWMPLHIEAYRDKTQGLTTQEHGAYLLLLIEYWRLQKPLPSRDKHLAGVARMSISEWLEVSEVILEYFTESDGLLRNKRMDQEIQKANDLMARNKENGAKGGRPRKPKNNPEVMVSVSKNDQNETQKKHTRGLRQNVVDEGRSVESAPPVIPNDDAELESVISGIERKARLSIAGKEAAKLVGQSEKLRGVS